MIVRAHRSSRFRFGWGCGSRNRSFSADNFGNEAVAAARECLDVTRIARRIAERVTQFVDGCVQAVIEVNEGVRRPKLEAQLFTSDEFAFAGKEHGEHLKGLLLQTEA